MSHVANSAFSGFGAPVIENRLAGSRASFGCGADGPMGACGFGAGLAVESSGSEGGVRGSRAPAAKYRATMAPVMGRRSGFGAASDLLVMGTVVPTALANKVTPKATQEFLQKAGLTYGGGNTSGPVAGQSGPDPVVSGWKALPSWAKVAIPVGGAAVLLAAAWYAMKSR